MLACAADYDCWHESEAPVTVEMVLGNLNANVTNAQRILTSIASKIPNDRSTNTCACSHALESSIISERDKIPTDVKEKYSLLIGKYLV